MGKSKRQPLKTYRRGKRTTINKRKIKRQIVKEIDNL